MAETKVSAAEREPEAQSASPEGQGKRPLLRSLGDRCVRPRSTLDSSGCSSPSAIIWIVFHIITPGHTFLTPRNIWNLSVQTAVVAIMATGMVLIIVTRNIDLSVGAVMAAVGMVMAIVQHDWLPKWIGFDHPLTWVIAIVRRPGAGRRDRRVPGGDHRVRRRAVVHRDPRRVPRVAGRRLVDGERPDASRRWTRSSGSLGGGSDGHGRRDLELDRRPSRRAWGSCVLQFTRRRQRSRYGFRQRPMWAEITIAVIACGAVLAAGWVPEPLLPAAGARGAGRRAAGAEHLARPGLPGPHRDRRRRS